MRSFRTGFYPGLVAGVLAVMLAVGGVALTRRDKGSVSPMRAAAAGTVTAPATAGAPVRAASPANETDPALTYVTLPTVVIVGRRDSATTTVADQQGLNEPVTRVNLSQ